MQCFRIDWKGIYPLGTVCNEPEARGTGIYAIYQMEYGEPKRFQNIGKAQIFSKRLKQHIRAHARLSQEQVKPKLSVCLGTVHPFEGIRISPQQLSDIESFLINAFKPQGNSDVTKRGYKGKPILVINNGKIGLFDKVMSNQTDLLKLLKENLTRSSW